MLFLRYGYALRNTTPVKVSGVVFRCYAPVAAAAGWRRTALEASGSWEARSDELGNTALLFDMGDFGPHEMKEVMITARLAALAPADQGEREESRALGDWLAAAPYLEADHPEIVRLAGRLRRPAPPDTAAAIFRWVSGNLTYAGYLASPRGALHALRQKQGDCTEYAALFVSLCRAAGIPARMLTGYAGVASGHLRPEEMHDWAEFYENGAWHVVDPQKGIFHAAAKRSVAFSIVRESGDSKGDTMLPFMQRHAVNDVNIQVTIR